MIERRWVRASQAAHQLGLSPRTLHRWRKSRQLKQRQHWRRVGLPGTERPQYQYNVPAIRTMLIDGSNQSNQTGQESVRRDDCLADDHDRNDREQSSPGIEPGAGTLAEAVNGSPQAEEDRKDDHQPSRTPGTRTTEFLDRAHKFCLLGDEVHAIGQELIADIEQIMIDLQAGIEPDCPTSTLVGMVTNVIATTEKLRALGLRSKGDQN
jgi:hypothetical protein